jgi:hypothetical protein
MHNVRVALQVVTPGPGGGALLRRRVAGGCVLLLVAGAFLVWMARSTLVAQTVYSVQQVRDGLAHHPGAWLGQIVRVRGTLLTTMLLDRHTHPPQVWLLVGRLPPVATTTMTYYDGASTTLYGTRPSDVRSRFVLRLVPGPPDAVTAVLRSLPFAWLLPVPQTNSAKLETATYPVQLQRAPAWLCGVPPCYQGIVQEPDTDSWRLAQAPHSPLRVLSQ